ncbi:uncharacterized protein NPIL_229611 [Nephila pilipes]|uniref:Uncharacterized protein n=1 Tax=Nephila pilipes TaxID=299642 RepID=A0A8X6URD3_NEPPI|nr:uncharacterized protein NPIL_229611 [Nephila pilipes]
MIHCFSDSMISCFEAANAYQFDEIGEVGEFRDYSEKKRKFNIVLSKETDRAEKSPTIPFNVYIGKGECLELKDFRKTLYLGVVKTNDKNGIKNRFNMHVDQITVLIEAIEHIRNHLKSM